MYFGTGCGRLIKNTVIFEELGESRGGELIAKANHIFWE